MSYVVGGCSTYSKVAHCKIEGYPEWAVWADGAMVSDMNRSYIDWTASLGATILGYAHPAVQRAARRGIDSGVNLPLPDPMEETAAELLCQAVGAEKLRWCKNGSDATEAAVRIARHATGRRTILTNSYHGSHDALLGAKPGKAGGVLPDVLCNTVPCPSPRQLVGNLHRWGRHCAAVIMESWTPREGEWPCGEIRQICDSYGVVLIFDEMLTGFRQRYGSAIPEVEPDLACFGKAIASGFPLACLTGKAKYMNLLEKEVFMSGTYAAESLSLNACRATLLALQEENYQALYRVGVRLQEALGDWVIGNPFRLTFDLPDEKLFPILGRLAKKGILVGRDWFPMFAHTDAQVDQTIRAILAVKRELAPRRTGALQFLTSCPECHEGLDPMYGWDPVIRRVEYFGRPELMKKEQCWNCGYTKAWWISLDWDDEERAAAMQAFEEVRGE